MGYHFQVMTSRLSEALDTSLDAPMVAPRLTPETQKGLPASTGEQAP
jgi:hypothetical protein